jgi:hypothetical protein
MLNQASRQLTAMGPTPATNELPITRAVTHSMQDAAPARSLLELGRPLPSFVQKATAILSDELKGLASRSTEPFGKAFPREPIDLESASERFREQARELVDTFVKILEHRPEEMGRFVSQVAAVRSSHGDDDTQFVPLLKPPPPVKAGQTGYILLSLENDDPNENIDCGLYMTDLVGRSGHRIPAAHVNMSPSPVRVPPGGSTGVRIEIRVPRGTPPGSYAGLLQVDDGSSEQAVLQLSVGS